MEGRKLLANTTLTVTAHSILEAVMQNFNHHPTQPSTQPQPQPQQLPTIAKLRGAHMCTSREITHL
eukprot:1103461-Rhodomonas_salina.1